MKLDRQTKIQTGIKGGMWLINKYPTRSVDNAGAQDTLYMYYYYAEGVTLKR